MRLFRFIITPLCLLYFTITYTYGQGCIGTQRVDASYELERNDICEGIEIVVRNTSQEFGNDNTFYVWDWGDGTKDTTYDASDVRHTYLLVNQDACEEGLAVLELRLDARVPGCTQYNHFVIKPVYVFLKPVALFNTEPLLCAPELTAMFDNQSCTADTGVVYTWNFGDPASGAMNTSSESEPMHTFSGPGIYNVTLTVSSGCGTGSVTQVIEVKAPPVALAEADIPAGAGCIPVIVNLRNRSTGALTFRWTVMPNNNGALFVDSTTNISEEPRILFTKAGNYTIRLEATNECGTTNWEQIVVISEPPTVNWTEPVVGCERLVYTPQITYGGSISSYSWTFEGGNPSTSSEANPTNIEFNTAGRFNITLTVNGACGNQSFIKTVEVILKEDITITPVEPLCTTSETVQLSVNLPGGTWSGTGVNSQGVFNPATATVGTNTIQYRYGPDNCRSEGSLDILVRAGTPLNVGDALSICNDKADITLDFSPSGGVWRGNGIIDSLQGIFSPVLAGVGAQALTYRYGDPTNGCVTTATKNVRVEPVPTVNITQETIAFCIFDGDVNLSNQLNLQVNPTGGTSNWTGTGITNASQGTFNSSNLSLGDYPILYTYTSPAGCVASDSFVIQIIPKQQAIAQADTTVCISIGSLTLEANPSGGQWSDSQNSINATTGVIDLARAGGGNKTYTYTIFPNSTCEAKDEVSVQIIDLSGVTAGPDVSFCESEELVTLSGFTPSGGVWRGIGMIDSIRGTVDIQQLIPGDYTFTYQIKSEAVTACAAEDQLVLTVHPLPQVGFNTSEKQCIGEPVRFTNTSTNAVTFNWNFGNGTNSTLENPEVTYDTAGNYNLIFNVTSQFGCENDTTAVIHISQPPPVVAFDLDQRVGCADLTVTFINRSQGEDVDFVWNFGNGQVDSISNPLPVIFLGNLEDTTYFVQLSAKNACGDQLFTDSIKVLSRPTASFGTRFGRYCSGEAVEIRNSSFGRPTSYFWDFGNGLTSRDSVPETQYYFTGNEPDTFQIRLIASNACASDTALQVVPINPADVDAFFNIDATEFCVGDTIRIRNLATPGASVTYQFGDSTTSATPNAQHVYREPGSYKLIQYARGCGFDSTFVIITVRQLPALRLLLDEFVCFESDMTFRYNATDIVGTSWDFGDGDTSLLPTPIHSYDSVGIFTVRLTATDANQCRASIQQDIEVLALPTFSLLTPDSLCVREPGLFEVISNSNLSSYTWQFGDQEQTSGRLVEHSYAESGIYTIMATVTDVFGCKNDNSRPIFVRPGPEAAFSFTALTGCAPTGIVFVNESKIANGYRWDFGDGNIADLTNPTNTYFTGGDYPVQLIASYDGICFDTLIQTITINPIPSAAIQVEDLTCHGKDDGRIQVTPNGDHLVTVTGADYFQQGGNLFEALKPGMYQVEVLSNAGCDTLYNVEVNEPDTLFAYIQPDTIRIVVGDTAIIQINANNANINYQWLPDSELTQVDISKFSTATQRSVLYELIATIDECQLRDQVFIEVDAERKIFIPNAFSPNGDNNNDFFYIHGGDGIIQINRFIIFERRGSTLFDRMNIQPNDPTTGWDGMHKGKKMNPAVFVYYAEISFKDGRTEIFSGDVTLVR